VSERTDQPWRRRLYLPTYQVAEAADYAGIAPQTVAAWHKVEADFLEKADKASLSYMQLVEVAVVAGKRETPLSGFQSGGRRRAGERGSNRCRWSACVGDRNRTTERVRLRGKARWAALKWHLAGRSSLSSSTSRIVSGSPAVKSIPTWIVKGRWDAGESGSDIAEDFDLDKSDVREALKFEGVVPGGRRESLVH
jgi:uncharacterized protein (DUF433 family)